jgi:hypothetical protein
MKKRAWGLSRHQDENRDGVKTELSRESAEVGTSARCGLKLTVPARFGAL